MKLSFQVVVLGLGVCHLGYCDLEMDSPSFGKEPPSGEQSCKAPQLEAFSKEAEKYLKHQAKLICRAQSDWVEIKGSRAYITEKAKAKFGRINCAFTDIYRRGEHDVRKGKTFLSNKGYSLKTSDFVIVQCRSKTGRKWNSTLSGIRRDEGVRNRTGWKNSATGFNMNLLMFGFDSMSRLSFIRKLPKTYKYVKNELNAIVLEGHNILGEGTKEAIIPILSGKKKFELLQTRSQMSGEADYVDVYPLVWKNFSKEGYVTGYMEYTVSFGIFTYAMKGFLKAPTDHYMRPFYVASDSFWTEDYCIGSIPRHKTMMDYVTNMFRVYPDKPKFIFGFNSELAHDSFNLVQCADDDLLEWIQLLKNEGHLDNTIFILMSDHGLRFTDFRGTRQGMAEERLPFFSFILPPSFEKSFPEAAANLRKNRERLTTHFDIYPTLLDVLYFQGARKGNLSERSISLFNEIPKTRTCSDAFVRPHWCACADWKLMNKTQPFVKEIAEKLVDFINKYIAKFTEKCHTLELSKVFWASQLVPDKSWENDDYNTYRIKVETRPGSALFESSLVNYVNSGKFKFAIRDITRVNRYGNQPQCVINTLPHLREFCNCKKRA